MSPEVRAEVLPRLRRIEGQVRGVQRMIDENRDCREIFTQISAIRAALASVNAAVFECYAHTCLGDVEQDHAATVAELIDAMLKATR